MSASPQELAAKREEISHRIAQQRRDLAEAYRDLGKPLHYAETGIRGVQFLRRNAWLVALSPSIVGLVFSLFGWKKERKKPVRGWFGLGQAKRAAEEETQEAAQTARRRARPLVTRLIGHGVTAYKFYRRIRPFIPL